MTQRFLIVGQKAYRDPMDAVADEKFKPGPPIAEFDTTARINEFYIVTRYVWEGDDNVKRQSSFYARTFEEVEAVVKQGELIEFSKLYVFPFLERKNAKEAA